MRIVLSMWVALGALLAPMAAAAQQTSDPNKVGKEITAAQTGISEENLADTPTTEVIDLWADGFVFPDLKLVIAVTPGDSLTVDVTCANSPDKKAFAPEPLCDAATPKSACVPDVRSFTLADYPTIGGKKYITSNWRLRRRYAQCSVDDPQDEDGTVTVTAVRYPL